MEDVKTVNVGSGYTDPKIYVGDDEVGDATTDADGKIVKLNLQKPFLDLVNLRLGITLELVQ